MIKLKVLTLNMHKGFSFAKRKFTLEELKVSIKKLGVDIVCLQEVVGQYRELERRSQFEFLADQIWQHYAYGKNAISSRGHHGNAILSHYPFESNENFDISNSRFERRGILYGVVNLQGKSNKRLHIMTLHLDLMSWGRIRQIEKLCGLIERRVPKDEPLIVCGDFNDWQEQVSLILRERADLHEAHFFHKGSHARTFPAGLPILKLDRVYLRNLKIECISRLDAKPWRELSDHLPLIADLRL